MFNTETLTATIAASNVRQLRDICKEYADLFDGYSPIVKKGKKALAAWMTKQVIHHTSPLTLLQSEPCELEISEALEEIQKTVWEAAASPWDEVCETESPIKASQPSLPEVMYLLPPARREVVAGESDPAHTSPSVQACAPVDLPQPVLKVVKDCVPKMKDLKSQVYAASRCATTKAVKQMYAQETGKTVDCRLKVTWSGLLSFCKGFAEGLSASGRERMRASGELPMAA